MSCNRINESLKANNRIILIYPKGVSGGYLVDMSYLIASASRRITFFKNGIDALVADPVSDEAEKSALNDQANAESIRKKTSFFWKHLKEKSRKRHRLVVDMQMYHERSGLMPYEYEYARRIAGNLHGRLPQSISGKPVEIVLSNDV